MPVAAIILAAGASRRLGQPKQLLLYRGESLLSRAIRLAHESGLSPVFVVLGANYELILRSTQIADEIVVINEHWEKGIASSIHAALHAFDNFMREANGALFMTCDQPLLTAEHLRGLIKRFDSKDAAAIVASSYGGVDGVPAIFPRSVFANLAQLEGDQGARKVLANPPCAMETVELAGGEIDIDFPSDLSKLCEI